MTTTNWIIVTVFLVLTLFNLYYLIYFWSAARKSSKVQEHDNYYKLDAKIELFKYLALGFITIITFFGMSEFTNISDRMDEFENLNEDYSRLRSEYQALNTELKNFKGEYEEMRNMYYSLQGKYKDTELEFYKQDQKIKDATRRIPEANVRVLTRQLVEIYLNLAGTTSLAIMPRNIEELEKAKIRSIEMLKSAGFTHDEIENIIK